MALIEANSTLGAIFGSMTQNVTGSGAMTLLLLIIIVMAFFLAMGVSTDISVVFVTPLLIFGYVYAANYGGTPLMATVIGLSLFYLAFVFVRNGPWNN
jgi:hypothetical protein